MISEHNFHTHGFACMHADRELLGIPTFMLSNSCSVNQFDSMNVGMPSSFLSVCMPTKPCVYHSCQKLNVSEYTAHDIPVLAYKRG